MAWDKNGPEELLKVDKCALALSVWSQVPEFCLFGFGRFCEKRPKESFKAHASIQPVFLVVVVFLVFSIFAKCRAGGSVGRRVCGSPPAARVPFGLCPSSYGGLIGCRLTRLTVWIHYLISVCFCLVFFGYKSPRKRSCLRVHVFFCFLFSNRVKITL